MLSFFKYLFVLMGVALLPSCTQKIDFENDVPQRAKSISQQQVEAVRSSMESPGLRQKYRQHMQQQGDKKTLAQLQREKREIELKISRILGSNAGNVCPLCSKKYNIKPSPKKAVVRKKKAAPKRPAQKKSAHAQPKGRSTQNNVNQQQPNGMPQADWQGGMNMGNQGMQQSMPQMPYPQEMPFSQQQMPGGIIQDGNMNNGMMMPQQPMPQMQQPMLMSQMPMNNMMGYQ